MKGAPEQLALGTLRLPPVTMPVDRPPPRAEDARRQAIEISRNRLLATGAVFALLFLVLAGRLVDVTLLRSGGEPTLARSAPAGYGQERATIVDRNGVLLAANLDTASLYANPRQVLDADEAVRKLVRVLPALEPGKLLVKLRSGRSFVWIKRNLTPRQQYAVNRLGLPGIAFQREQRRVYPQGQLAAHVLGYADLDNRGIAGVESFFDGRLREARGDQGPLQLSLDVRVQHVLRQELAWAFTEYRALGAAGIVLDARSGEVLALVSLPDFDPNRIAASRPEERFNRATLGVYEIGSVFKTFTMALALDSGTVDLSDGYDVTKPIRIARFTIRDLHGKKRWLSVAEIFMYSSNIGAAKIALDSGSEAQRAFLGRLGLLGRSTIELPEVGLPLYPARWGDVSTMTIAFGHGIAVTPLHVASAVAAVVNGGVLVPTTLLKRRADEPVAARQVLSPRTSETMRRLMRLVVTSGTGKNAEAPGYLVGGKTGTADKPSGGGYRRDTRIASFVGAFPMTAPRYVVFAFLDEPKGNSKTAGFATGGWVAAPVVGRVVARIAPILGVREIDEEAPEVRRAMTIPVAEGKAKLASF